jgi:hypothetical protein
MLLAVSWLRRLVASLSLWRPGFIHVEFVVDKAALGQFFFQSFCFPINVLSPGLHTHIYCLEDEQEALWWPQFRDII